MNPNENLAQYLKDSLFKTFADNRKVLEPDWERNKDAYEMRADHVPQRLGVGNKRSKKDKNDWRSKSVADLTRVKTNAGKILVCDVLLAGGRIPFRLKEQPVINSIIDRVLQQYAAPVAAAGGGNGQNGPYGQDGQNGPSFAEAPAFAQSATEGMPEGMPPGAPERMPQEGMMPAESAEGMPEQQDVAAEESKGANFLMNELVQEQMIEAQADVALKRAVKDAAIYGEGISRIYASRSSRTAFKNINGEWAETSVSSETLKMRNVSIWDFFTDLEDHDIQHNIGVFERRMMSLHDVRAEFADDGDNEFNVKGALNDLESKFQHNGENETRDNESPHKRAINQRKKNLQVLEFFGRVPARYVREMQQIDSGDDESREDVEIMAIVVEDTLVRFAEMEPGMRPFVRIAWEEPADSLRGTGVADSCSAAQQALDSIMRLIEDNKKVTCNASFAKKSIYFANQHDKDGFYPGKEIEIDVSCDDVRKAIQPITFPDVGSTGMDLVSLYRESGNEASMIPEISHGVAPSANTTAYEVSVRNEKAGKYISDVVRGIDDNWIEPVAMYFYRWNMMNPEVPEDFKGSFAVEPMGFASYNDRVLRMNNVKEIMSICLGNQMLAERVNISKLLAEWMRNNDLDPSEFMNPEGEQLNPIIQQLTEQIGQKFQQVDQVLRQIMQALPSLSGKSELDAAEQQARIGKLQAETQKIADSTALEMEKEKTKRAGMIANIEAKNEELDQKGAMNALQFKG